MDPCDIGKVPRVTIVEVDKEQVRFTADSKLVSVTNSSAITDRRILGTYVARVAQDAADWNPKHSEVWEPTATFTDEGIAIERFVQRAVGATGPLYLRSAALRRHGTSANGPCVIRGSGATALLKDELAIPLKWPDCGGGGGVDEFKLKPTGITVTCYAAGTAPKRIKLDLFDASVASPAQAIKLGGASIELALTPHGCDVLGVAHQARVQVFPLRVKVTGSLSTGVGHAGSVDLRDQTLALAVQSLVWQQAKDEIAVVLTPLGAGSTFGVFSPQVLHALAHFKDDPKLQDMVRTLWQAGDALDSLEAQGSDLTDSPTNRSLERLLGRLRGRS